MGIPSICSSRAITARPLASWPVTTWRTRILCLLLVRLELSSKPFQLSFDTGSLIVLQKVFEQRHRGPKATNPYPHLMHTFGICFYNRWYIIGDLFQTGKPITLKLSRALLAGGRCTVDRRDRVRMVAQECPPRLLGGPRCLIMYLETVDSATSKPILSSSPWMRGAPHNGFSLLICRIRSRNSRSIFGRPARCRDFHRQNALNPERCH